MRRIQWHALQQYWQSLTWIKWPIISNMDRYGYLPSLPHWLPQFPTTGTDRLMTNNFCHNSESSAKTQPWCWPREKPKRKTMKRRVLWLPHLQFIWTQRRQSANRRCKRKDGEPKEELSKNLHPEFLLHFQKHVTTSERILSVFIGQITFSNQAYKKSPRAEGVRL